MKKINYIFKTSVRIENGEPILFYYNDSNINGETTRWLQCFNRSESHNEASVFYMRSLKKADKKTAKLFLKYYNENNENKNIVFKLYQRLDGDNIEL